MSQPEKVKSLLILILLLDAVMLGGLAYGIQQKEKRQNADQFYTNLFGVPPSQWKECGPCLPSNQTVTNPPLIKQYFAIVICRNGVILNPALYAYAIAHNQTNALIGCGKY